jgi:hypothetical protein
VTALILALALATQGPQMDSLIAAANRGAAAWRAHDFGALVAGAGEIAVQLPEATPSGPLRAAQAAELLRAFVAGARELEVEVTVARSLDADRAYVEMRRVFTVRGAGAPRSQRVYLGLQRNGAGFRVAEVRVVP